MPKSVLKIMRRSRVVWHPHGEGVEAAGGSRPPPPVPVQLLASCPGPHPSLYHQGGPPRGWAVPAAPVILRPDPPPAPVFATSASLRGQAGDPSPCPRALGSHHWPCQLTCDQVGQAGLLWCLAGSSCRGCAQRTDHQTPCSPGFPFEWLPSVSDNRNRSQQIPLCCSCRFFPLSDAGLLRRVHQ